MAGHTVPILNLVKRCFINKQNFNLWMNSQSQNLLWFCCRKNIFFFESQQIYNRIRTYDFIHRLKFCCGFCCKFLTEYKSVAKLPTSVRDHNSARGLGIGLGFNRIRAKTIFETSPQFEPVCPRCKFHWALVRSLGRGNRTCSCQNSCSTFFRLVWPLF